MKITKAQLDELERWAKEGRLTVNLHQRDVPSWVRSEFDLARELVRLARRNRKDAA